MGRIGPIRGDGVSGRFGPSRLESARFRSIRGEGVSERFGPIRGNSRRGRVGAIRPDAARFRSTRGDSGRGRVGAIRPKSARVGPIQVDSGRGRVGAIRPDSGRFGPIRGNSRRGRVGAIRVTLTLSWPPPPPPRTRGGEVGAQRANVRRRRVEPPRDPALSTSCRRSRARRQLERTKKACVSARPALQWAPMSIADAAGTAMAFLHTVRLRVRSRSAAASCRAPLAVGACPRPLATRRQDSYVKTAECWPVSTRTSSATTTLVFLQ